MEAYKVVQVNLNWEETREGAKGLAYAKPLIVDPLRIPWSFPPRASLFSSHSHIVKNDSNMH
jgi:hypothetical protein